MLTTDNRPGNQYSPWHVVDLSAAGMVNKGTAKVTGGWRPPADPPMAMLRTWGLVLDCAHPQALSPGSALSVPCHSVASHLILASTCAPAAHPAISDEFGDESLAAELDAIGEPIAELKLEYGDGTFASVSLRRRFEMAPPRVTWGRQPFVARPHREDQSLDPSGSCPATSWGHYQGAVAQGYELGSCYWLSAIENPHPDRRISAVQVQSIRSTLVLGALTLWCGQDAPLAAPREMHIAIDGGVDPVALEVVDGIPIRTVRVDPPGRQEWLESPGLRGFGSLQAPTRRLIVEFAGRPASALRIGDETIGVGRLVPDSTASIHGLTLTALAVPTVRMRIRLCEEGKTVCGRVHLRSSDGRELNPVDRGRIVSDRFYEDAGADVVVGGWRYAYVDTEFELLAPSGAELFVEVVRGPAHEVHRGVYPVVEGSLLEISPTRIADPRSEGWLASDTHVHFVNPRALHRQAKAEGLELVHLMSAQWGELYTNVEDLAEGPAIASDEAAVWAGSENRHHALGHMLSVGTPSVRPLSSGGADEARIGDSTRMLLSDWADQARESGGLAILAHFPDPYLECVADLLLGRFDAAELWFAPHVASHHIREWYRFLNVGLHIPIVSGTDKMQASSLLGHTRTYTYTGSPVIDFAAWSAAIRAGRTYVTTGPLIQITLDDEVPGATLPDRENHTCRWQIHSAAAVTALEIVANEAVIHRQPLMSTAQHHEGSATLALPDRGWVAVRISGPDSFPVWAERRGIGAHTSPFYLSRPAIPSPAEISRFRTLLEGAEGWGRMAGWESRAVSERFEKLVAEARRSLDVVQ